MKQQLRSRSRYETRPAESDAAAHAQTTERFKNRWRCVLSVAAMLWRVTFAYLLLHQARAFLLQPTSSLQIKHACKHAQRAVQPLRMGTEEPAPSKDIVERIFG
jgi:hypothetical protein